MDDYQLTKREMQILRAIAEEGSEAEAAVACKVALQTVKNTTYGVRHKMGAKSTLQAIYWLIADGNWTFDD